MGRGKDWERKSVIKALDGGKESIGWRNDVSSSNFGRINKSIHTVVVREDWVERGTGRR